MEFTQHLDQFEHARCVETFQWKCLICSIEAPDKKTENIKKEAVKQARAAERKAKKMKKLLPAWTQLPAWLYSRDVRTLRMLDYELINFSVDIYVIAWLCKYIWFSPSIPKDTGHLVHYLLLQHWGTCFGNHPEASG